VSALCDTCYGYVADYLFSDGMRDSILFDPLANHGEGLRGEPLERIVKFLKDEA
jgi:hypothetical protein